MRNFLLYTVILFLTEGCATNGNATDPADQNAKRQSFDTLPIRVLAGNFSDQRKLKLDSTEIRKFLLKYPLFQSFENELYLFYRLREYAYAWHDEKGLIEQANILYTRVLHMEDNGLPLDIPYLDTYERLMEMQDPDSNRVRELVITGEYLHFAKKFLSVLSDRETHSLEWYIPRKKVDYTIFLEQLLVNDSTLTASFYPQFGLLREALGRYRTFENKGGWDVLTLPRGRPLVQGDSGQWVKQLRKRLLDEGYRSGLEGGKEYDLDLFNAVRQFQADHGFTSNGVLDKKLIAAMNVPVRQRIEQIMVNMERCRWLQKETDRAYMVINIPEFKAYIHEGDSIVYASRVVVGKETHKTVIFKGDMKCIVFSPYWNVPESILRKEILPEWRKNPNYLTINNMEWVDGKLRQRPGEDNALGRIKFIFPNAYHIYLHDTPSKQLFEQEKRTFSHGCIRLSSPRELALYLLKDQPLWTEKAIDEAMAAGKERMVALRTPLPVYVVYFTAFVDGKGHLQFREDVYGRDPSLRDMILKK